MKNAIKHPLAALATVTLAAFVATGCQSTIVIKNPATPISVKDTETAAIVVSKVSVDSSLLGKEIGASHGGLAHIAWSKYTITEAFVPCAQAAQELELELTAAGYKVIRTSGLFQEAAPKPTADFLMGGN